MRVKIPTDPTIPNPQDPKDAPQSHNGGGNGFMPYISAWERLADAIRRVTAGRRPKELAQIDLCQAIADRTVKIQGKLRKHTTRPSTTKRILEGKDFEIPAEIKPADLDWDSSRPLKPWTVHREIFGFPGQWELEWIELFRTDVTDVLCGGPTEKTSSKTGSTSRSRPARERARQAIKELYPQDVPEPATLPNALLCRRVGEKLKERGLPQVSDDTILRVAGRRK